MRSPKPKSNATSAVAAAGVLAATTLTSGYAFTVNAVGATSTPETATVTEKAGEPISASVDLVDAKLAVAEARTETKFAQLLGEIRLIASSVSHLGEQLSGVKADIASVKTEVAGVRSATATVKWNVLATGLAIGGLILAIAGFGATIMQTAVALVGAK